jgi:Arc/MetJ-type ribon-helix-helix transcriptional regulator
MSEQKATQGNGRRRARVGDVDNRPRRLLKSWQEAELVRQMDALILSTSGAYADRSEFIAEALRDRIEAEHERLRVDSSATTEPGDEDVAAVAPEVELILFADWIDGDPPTKPRAAGPEINYGLHNRDFPTLWAADWLGRITADAGAPIAWREFLAQVTPRAWEYGRLLATRDLDRPPGVKLAAGFPTNLKKREAAESRFRAHAVGYPSERNQGPLFVFGLVGLDGEDEDALAALSAEGIALLTRLAGAGISDGPPFTPEAWTAFAEHLGANAPKERETWMRVLEIVGDEPDRSTLVERCDWWSGTTADTNAMSYVARGREWGLVEPRLREGRYALTELGRGELGHTSKSSNERIA